MFKKLGVVFLLCLHVPAFSQTDTARILTYNLLNYGNGQANRPATKNAYLQPILNLIRPAITGFNEIGNTPGLFDTINSIMPYTMEHGGIHNTANTDLLDALFWKEGKFKRLRDTIICAYVRDITAYELYYNDSLLGSAHDSVKITLITAHLKSSNAAADRATRDTETRRVMRYLEQFADTQNVVIMGDFNLYRSAEPAYQNLTVTAGTLARFYDPLDRPGAWDGVDSFAAIHTQSPRKLQLSDGGASGGLDSRFDFILMSEAMIRGWKGIKYVPGSYTAFGNDGRHFKKALTDTPVHPTLPAGIIQALYSCSDHIPVYADIAITPPLRPQPPVPTTHVPVALLNDVLTFSNPVHGRIQYLFRSAAGSYDYVLLAPDGRLVRQGTLDTAQQYLDVQDLQPGMYFLQVRSDRGATGVWKLLCQ